MTIPDNLYGYHVHIYYDDATEAASIALHDRLIASSEVSRAGPSLLGSQGLILSPKGK